MTQDVFDCHKAYGILSEYHDSLDIRLNDIESYLCPAMVDAVGRVLGRGHKNLAVLADILMCLYLSDIAHEKIKDGGWESDGMPSRQYSVLVGDYWLSESFWQMISHQIFAQISLRHFTGLVKTMKEGALLRWKMAQNLIGREGLPTIWEMERGALMALSGKLAAEILGADGSAVTLFERFGRYLGLAWAAGEEVAGAADGVKSSGGVSEISPLWAVFLAEAKALIGELACFGNVTALEEVLDFLEKELNFRAKSPMSADLNSGTPTP
ncbi:MAG: hypothetical protein FWG40_09470 [Peptococcaceae bacterium]|nr:hypothetical protein [Peptococcaceae bacterium]